MQRTIKLLRLRSFCTRFLKEKGLPPKFSFGSYNDNGNKSLHIKAYKRLRRGLRVVEANGGRLNRIEKPLIAWEWILAQEVPKEQEMIEREGRRNEILVAEVETDNGESEIEEGNNNEGEIIS